MNKITLISLPTIPLNSILIFLFPKTIYCSLSLTCKTMFFYIKSSNYLTKEIQSRCLGLSDYSQLSKDYDLIELLNSLTTFDHLKDIPFYGYFTDGGIDQNKTEYWVNRMFTRGNWSICSRSGKNIHVIGGLLKAHENISDDRLIFFETFQLAQGLFEEKSFFHKFFSCFKRRPTEIEIYFRERMFRMMLSMNKLMVLELLENNREKIQKHPILKNYTILEIMARLENFEKKCEIPIENIAFINDYELLEKNIELERKKIAIVRGVEVSRKGYFTCPVKTLMVFLSEEEVNYKNDPEFKIFNECFTVYSLKTVLSNYSLINNIKVSNVEELAEFSEIKQKPSNGYELVVFRNNLTTKALGKYKPMLWLNITDPNLNSVSVEFPKTNSFAGRNIMVKMFDSEKKETEENDFNIDINYIVFMGRLISL